VASAFSIEGRGRRLTVIGGDRQSWNDIFQSYGLMAMRSEQHGNVFAKLNNGNFGRAGARMKGPPS